MHFERRVNRRGRGHRQDAGGEYQMIAKEKRPQGRDEEDVDEIGGELMGPPSELRNETHGKRDTTECLVDI